MIIGQEVSMRINRNMLLKLANDTAEKSVNADRSIIAIYLQGSLLSDEPLIGNTADIDLFFVHNDEVSIEREIVKVSDEVHLDISHHSHRVYRQPRELRVDPWLGPVIYNCKIMYDPQHFIDFVQASVRGQFNNPENVVTRVQKQAVHAREMWESFNDAPHQPDPQDASLYLQALEHSADAIAGLNGHSLTERRFLPSLLQYAEAVHKPGLYKGFLGLLGASAVDANGIRTWLPEWRSAYSSLAENQAPVRLHIHRLLYYERAIAVMLDGQTPHDALWPLWRTWTHIIRVLPDDSTHRAAWQTAGERLGLLGEAFSEKIEALDAYLDQVEELLENWGRENGIQAPT
jgi:hypothetical protein